MSAVLEIPTDQKKGAITVLLEVPSFQLRESLPIEVRDSRLSLVKTLLHDEKLDVEPGMYEVSAVLDDGIRHTRLVKIESGSGKTVKLSVNAGDLAVRGNLEARSEDVAFIEAVESIREEESGGRWRFSPDSRRPSNMPLVRLRVKDSEFSVSLPVNPRGYDELAAGFLSFERRGDQIGFRASLHPRRLVSTAIQNMVKHGQFAQAAASAERTADDMLRSKYQDPVGAALGAVILFRAGRLERRLDWLHNLVRDFDWLPDGKILLACLRNVVDKAEAVELLIRASEQRPMFTDSFSLLFGALRRWDGEDREDEIKEALGRVAKQARGVDWSAFTLTTREV